MRCTIFLLTKTGSVVVGGKLTTQSSLQDTQLGARSGGASETPVATSHLGRQ